MKDNLERFVQEHRGEFDPHTPPEHLWRTIEGGSRKRRRLPIVFYPAAASILIIAGVFVWFMWRPAQKNIPAQSIEVAINPEIKEAEVYYASIVESKRTELSKFGRDFPDLFKDFNAEIDTLHVLYQQLEAEYKNSNGNEAVMQALVANLQMQVQLLNKQIRIIQDIKEKGTPNHSNPKLM